MVGKGLGEFYVANKMEQFASALEELGVLEVADLAEVTDAQLDAMGMTVIQRKRLGRDQEELITVQGAVTL